MRSLSFLGLSGLLIVSLFAWSACQTDDHRATMHRPALSDSLERGYERLQARYQRMGDSLPRDLRAMAGPMQQMHWQMMGGNSTRGRARHRGMGEEGMMGRHHRQMHGGAQREWHQQMHAIHRQMAQMHHEHHPGMAAQHQQMAQWHQQMSGAVPVDTAAAPPTADRPVVSGGAVYQQQCATCHGADGQGLAGSFPPLSRTEWVMGDTDRLVRILLHGLQGPMEVRETRYNGVMPAFGQRLSDAEIAAVLTYVRTSWANGASDVTEADVREVRRQFPNRQQPWSASALRDDS